MILNLWEDCRRVLAEGNYTPWLVTADEFADRVGECGYDGAAEMESLLRGFVRIQELVRMSSPDQVELKELRTQAAELQKSFTTPPQLNVGRAMYGLPFGPYYLGITVPMDYLAHNMELLSTHPIRYMNVTQCQDNDDLAMILRNYRVAEQFRTTFTFNRQPRHIMKVAKAVEEAKLYWSLQLSFSNVFDVNRMVEVHFQMNRSISRGTRLSMGRPPAERCVHG